MEGVQVGSSEFGAFKCKLFVYKAPNRLFYNDVPILTPGGILDGYLTLEVLERSFIRGCWIKIVGEASMHWKQPSSNSMDTRKETNEIKIDIFDHYIKSKKQQLSALEEYITSQGDIGDEKLGATVAQLKQTILTMTSEYYNHGLHQVLLGLGEENTRDEVG